MHVAPHRQAGCCVRGRPEDVWPLVVLYVSAADGLTPPRGQAQVTRNRRFSWGELAAPAGSSPASHRHAHTCDVNQHQDAV